MKCEYVNKLNRRCDGELFFVGKYRQDNDIISVYECEKCGCRTGKVKE